MASNTVKVKKKTLDIRVSMMDADMDFPVQVIIYILIGLRMGLNLNKHETAKRWFCNWMGGVWPK